MLPLDALIIADVGERDFQAISQGDDTKGGQLIPGGVGV